MRGARLRYVCISNHPYVPAKTKLYRTPLTYNYRAQCLFLNILLRGKVSFPQSSIYEAQNIHWSQQQTDVRSVCRVAPSAAVDVSATLLTLKTLSCQFAVKSGGHASFKGASNIDEGVTIDLVNLKQITLSADKTQASIGPGNRWLDVYSTLDPLGVSVAGGRVEDIGVGGLTLGGGISYFSGRFGFSCDNVNAYQVCLDESPSLLSYLCARLQYNTVSLIKSITSRSSSPTEASET